MGQLGGRVGERIRWGRLQWEVEAEEAGEEAARPAAVIGLRRVVATGLLLPSLALTASSSVPHLALRPSPRFSPAPHPHRMPQSGV